MSINKILRFICLAGIFLIPFIPLIVANSYFFPFITGKNFAFRIIVEIIFGAWVVLAVTDKAYQPRKSWLLYILAAFVVIIFFADITGVYPYKSFWSNYERMEGFVTLAHAFVYFLVISSVLSTEKLWNWFWSTSIGVSFILCIYGIMQYLGMAATHQGSDRVDASLGNSAYFAVYLLFHIFIILYIVVSPRWKLFYLTSTQKSPVEAYVGGAFILIEGFVLFNTGTRGSILGLIGGLLLAALLILIFERRDKRLRTASGVVIAAVIVIVVGFIGIRKTDFVKNHAVLNRFASISVNDKTTNSRFILWKMAITSLEGRRALLGYGQENFNYIFNAQYSPKLYDQEQWFDRTHNVIFDWLVAGGILGLAGYLAFFGAIIYYIWKPGGNDDFSVVEKSVLTGLLAAYFTHNFFVFDNLVSYIMYFSFAGYIYSRRTFLKYPVEHTYADNRAIAPVVLIATACLVYYINVPAIRANVTLIQAINVNPQGNISDNLELFKKVLNYNSFGNPEAREQIFNLTEQVAGAVQQNPALGQVASQFLQFAYEETQKQIARTPNDARYYLLPGSVFSHAGQYDIAIPLLEKGVSLTPQKQSALFELAGAYIGKNETSKAFQTLKTAYELDKDNAEAKMMYAVGAIYDKQPVVANEILKDFTPKEIAHNDQIVRAYYTVKDFKKVIEIWKQRVVDDPTNADLHVSLAAAYLLTKDKKNSIAQLQEAIKLKPDFKEQGEEYIKQIKSGQI
jgi:O-antigen ligase/cytochrome c-type biogenesis protein CcmH/NrfG